MNTFYFGRNIVIQKFLPFSAKLNQKTQHVSLVFKQFIRLEL
jgi:hypothetical protein